MNLIDKLKTNIKKNEGWSSVVYTDTLGYKTIGYGFKVDELEFDVSKNYEMSKEIAEKMLDDKIIKLISKITKRFRWIEQQPESIRLVIYEICYQIGITGFSRFKKTIKFLKNKEYVKASFELLDSKLAKQTYKRTLRHAKTIAFVGLDKKDI